MTQTPAAENDDALPGGAVEDKTYERESVSEVQPDPDDLPVDPADAEGDAPVEDPDDREVVLEDEGYGA
ncbi:hypothetical protein [Nigerium massiliense]|uniref:hypothetical protein n=1 Tax=Nigerium massiliense TaxID=1522317 RepID=UPI000590F26B|nr:hypothetical protein [Nigerium massiliense]